MEQFINQIADKYSLFGSSLFDALLVLLVGLYAIRLSVKILEKMLHRSNVDQIVINFLKPIVSIGLKIILFITVLSILGVPVTSFVAVLTTAGAAIVLGLQDSMKGIVSGITILFAKPFVKGDLIEINGYIGKIEEIQMLYTILKTPDNKMVVIPNNELASNTFVNYSHEQLRRVDMIIDVHYDSDVDKAKEIILDVIKNNPYAILEPAPYIRVSQYKESAISISVKVWTKNETFYDLRDDLNEEIKRKLDSQGIHMPYNQLEIHVHNN